MNESSIRLGRREQQIAELLLQGCDNSEIARQLKMARRTVKAHFNRLFLRFAITGGIKRVKLATILYRRQLCSENSVTEIASPASENSESLNSLPKDSKTAKSRTPSAQRRIIYDKLGLWNRVELALWYEARRQEVPAQA
jgi:DNA-binding NarL/FixJ family response regulator